MKAEEILKNQTAEYDGFYGDEAILKAMKQIAELAFDAGYERGITQGMIDWTCVDPENDMPSKEQFINDLFNTYKP